MHYEKKFGSFNTRNSWPIVDKIALLAFYNVYKNVVF